MASDFLQRCRAPFPLGRTRSLALHSSRDRTRRRGVPVIPTGDLRAVDLLREALAQDYLAALVEALR